MKTSKINFFQTIVFLANSREKNWFLYFTLAPQNTSHLSNLKFSFYEVDELAKSADKRKKHFYREFYVKRLF